MKYLNQTGRERFLSLTWNAGPTILKRIDNTGGQLFKDLSALLSKYNPKHQALVLITVDDMEPAVTVLRVLNSRRVQECKLRDGIELSSGERRQVFPDSDPLGGTVMKVLTNNKNPSSRSEQRLFQKLFACQNATCDKLESKRGQFQRCGVCRRSLYCSRECQLLDWRVRHKQECIVTPDPPPEKTDEEEVPTLSDVEMLLL